MRKNVMTKNVKYRSYIASPFAYGPLPYQKVNENTSQVNKYRYTLKTEDQSSFVPYGGMGRFFMMLFTTVSVECTTDDSYTVEMEYSANSLLRLFNLDIEKHKNYPSQESMKLINMLNSYRHSYFTIKKITNFYDHINVLDIDDYWNGKTISFIDDLDIKETNNDFHFLIRLNPLFVKFCREYHESIDYSTYLTLKAHGMQPLFIWHSCVTRKLNRTKPAFFSECALVDSIRPVEDKWHTLNYKRHNIYRIIKESFNYLKNTLKDYVEFYEIKKNKGKHAKFEIIKATRVFNPDDVDLVWNNEKKAYLPDANSCPYISFLTLEGVMKNRCVYLNHPSSEDKNES